MYVQLILLALLLLAFNNFNIVNLYADTNIIRGTVCDDRGGQKTATDPDGPNGPLPFGVYLLSSVFCTISPDTGINVNRDLNGTKNSDIIIGLEGDDTLRGKSGNDILQGGFDNDILFGNKGDDNLQGSFGQDVLYGNQGNDMLLAGINDDLLEGGDGNDELYGDDGFDILKGNDGADYFDCGPDQDIIIDFDSSEGDAHANNCEDVRKHP